MARIVDSLTHWGLARARWLGLGLLAAAIAEVATQGVLQRSRSLPLVPDAEPDLRLLFFNVLREKAAFADRIVSAVLAADVDIMVFAEGEALYSALPRIGRTHEALTPCDLDECPLLIASRLPSLRT